MWRFAVITQQKQHNIVAALCLMHCLFGFSLAHHREIEHHEATGQKFTPPSKNKTPPRVLLMLLDKRWHYAISKFARRGART